MLKESWESSRLNLTEEQRIASSLHDRPVTLIAAAGSGKTTVLVERYLSLLSLGAHPSEILTVTFTNEAADQLRERIVFALRTKPLISPKTLAAVESSSRIGTIHSFCYSILDLFGSIIKLSPIQRIVTPYEFAWMFDRLYRDWVEKLDGNALTRVLELYRWAEIRKFVLELYQHRMEPCISSSLTRISHQLSTRAGDMSVISGVFGPQRLNIASAMPHLFGPAVARTAGHLTHLATKSGEKCGLNTPVITEEEGENFLFLKQLTWPLVGSLERHFRDQGAYSFDELEHLSLEILKSSPESLNFLRSRISHILVDEFQDTSRTQWKIIELVTGDQAEKLFLVGDPKQSIYGFRGADVSVFLEVSDKIQKKGGQICAMKTNFRSRASLLVDINRIGEELFSNSEVPFLAMEPGKSDITSETSPGVGIEFHRFGRGAGRSELAKYEMREVVDTLHRLVHDGIRPSHIALLFRVSDRISSFHKKLVESGIPATCKKTGRLFHCYDILDLVHFLKTLENPLDDFTLTSFLRSPFIGWKADDLIDIFQKPGTSLFDKLLKNNQSYLQWLFYLIDRGPLTMSHALKELFSHCRYWPNHSEAFFDFLKALSPLERGISEALEQIRTWEEGDIRFESPNRGSDSDSVQLLTVHAAKGLEFPHVFIVDNLRAMSGTHPFLLFTDEGMPGIRFRKGKDFINSRLYEELSDMQKNLDEEEERRILYVALTRAEQSLHLFLPEDASLIPKNTWGKLLLSSA